VKAILVIATRQIGDVLLTTPLVRAARRRWPGARIEVLGFPGTLGMLRGNPDIDALLEAPARLRWPALRQLAARLWRRYDLALVTQPGDRAHLLGWLAAPRRSGIVPAGGSSSWWKRLLLAHAVESAGDGGDVHAVSEKLALLQPWLDGAPAEAAVVPPPAAPLPADVQAQLQPGAVVLHAPSMWEYKQWPLQHYRALAQGLLAQGRQLVLTGGPGERDKACVAALRDLAPAPQLLDLAGRLDFNQLTGLLEQAALYVGPDTSVSHLAAAAGAPVLALFGPTNPRRWAPWPAGPAAQALFERSALQQVRGNVTLLQGGIACVPCSLAGCEDHVHSRSDCLPAITPERALARALALLGTPQRS